MAQHTRTCILPVARLVCARLHGVLRGLINVHVALGLIGGLTADMSEGGLEQGRLLPHHSQ